ncbi:putative ribonuclease H-like domain-containing protein [Tanacetum coccineum]
MVTVPIHRDTSYVPLMTIPVIDLTVSQPVSTTIQALLPTSIATVTAITTTTISLPLIPPQLQQGSSDSILIQRIGELEQHMADIVEANQALEERLDKQGNMLYNLENLDIPYKVSKAMDEIVTDVRSFTTACGNPTPIKLMKITRSCMKLWSTTPPPPPAGPSGTSGTFEASESSQFPPPPPPPPSTNQSDQSTSTAAPSSSKTAASAEYTAWTTTDTRIKPSVSSIPEELHMEDDTTPDKQVQSSGDEDIGHDHIPMASALAFTYAPPLENSLLVQTSDMAIFMDYLPGQVMIQSDFFFNKDLEYPPGQGIQGQQDESGFEHMVLDKERLNFNLFSVSQICDKKNSVLFIDTECVVLSLDFKLTDESHVLLKVPRKDNMYSVDLKNVVPQGGLTCLFAKATPDESNLWHRRLGHVNFKTMNKLVRGNLVRGLPSKLFEINQTCVACQKGKQHRASCKTKTVSSISQPLQMLHMDLFGPTFVKSLMKKMYCLVVTDDFSRFSWVFFLATKDETSEILKTFITGIENLIDLRVKVIRCDNGTEFKNRVMNQFCEMKGIKREFSVARTPQQNGVAERKNRTLIEAARTMLADSKLPTTFWAEAVNTACYVQNRVLVIKPHNKTPYELFLGRKPALSFMRPFGCPVTILNTIDHLGKFDGKADEGFFVGYSTNSKAFRVFNSRTRIVEENLHVQFSENTPNIAGSGPNWLFDIDALTKSMNYKPVVAGNQSNGSTGTKACDNAGIDNLIDLRVKVIRYDNETEFKNRAMNQLCEMNGIKREFSVARTPQQNGVAERKNRTLIEEVDLIGFFDIDALTNSMNYKPVIAGNQSNGNACTKACADVGKARVETGRKEENKDAEEPEMKVVTQKDDDEDVGAEADMNNLDAFMPVSPIPTTRIHKDHLVD